jgi:methyltransferase (TIGR00027 family)
VASLRAELDRPHTPGGDKDAQQLLCRGIRPVRSEWLRHQVAARTQFFDQQLLTAITAGVKQIVICGAGYDDRAFRFRTPGVCYFELDHPASQAEKARRLRAVGIDTIGLELAPADFRTDDVAKVLQDHGHDADLASLFVCEGLLVYLDQPTCVRLLAGLRSRAAPGSTLAVSLATHRVGIDSDYVTATMNARRRTGQSEPWRTILPVDSHLALVERAEWHVEQTLDAVKLDPAAIPGHTQLVTAAPNPF